MFYTDIHCHLISGVDDGAKTPDVMYEMLALAYRSGTRNLCATPHYYPDLFGGSGERSVRAFEALAEYAKGRYPDMKLFYANEMGYHTSWRKAVESGACKLLGGKYLFVDFPADLSFFEISYAMDDMLCTGIPVVLAHVERYLSLRGEYDKINDWCRRGAHLQMNASAFHPKRSFGHRMHVKKLIAKCPITAVASDGHNLTSRPPMLSHTEERIAKKYGAERAELWLSYGPLSLLEGKAL
jgi:protein-tyrosine phosphatase